MISKQAVVPNAFYTLVVAIRELLSKNWHVSITHIYREANSAADFMTNMTYSVSFGLHLFPNLHVGIYFIISQDMFEITQHCLVPA